MVIVLIAPLIAIVVSWAEKTKKGSKENTGVMGQVTQVSNEIANGAQEIKSCK